MSDQDNRARLKIECRWMLQIAQEQPSLDLMKVCELAAGKADQELAELAKGFLQVRQQKPPEHHQGDDDAPETERQPYTYDAQDDRAFEFPDSENDNDARDTERPEGDDSPTGGGWLAR